MSDRIFTLQCIADLAPLTNAARKAAREWAIRTKTKGTHPRFRRMRDQAEVTYERLRRNES